MNFLESVFVVYATILSNTEMTDQEKAGYLVAASRIDPRVKEITFREVYAFLVAVVNKEGHRADNLCLTVEQEKGERT